MKAQDGVCRGCVLLQAQLKKQSQELAEVRNTLELVLARLEKLESVQPRASSTSVPAQTTTTTTTSTNYHQAERCAGGGAPTPTSIPTKATTTTPTSTNQSHNTYGSNQACCSRKYRTCNLSYHIN